MKKLILIMSLIAITLSSCLKDKTYVDFPNAGNIVNFPLSGLTNFGSDAETGDTVKFAVDYATAKANAALTVTIAVDTTLVAKYNAANPSGIQYLVLPASAYKFTSTKITIAAGAQYAFTTLIFDRTLLDPAASYMVPVKITDASGVAISANQSVHYYHIIGNDFAGIYTYDYRRFQNGTGPGAGDIPSLGQGSAPDISTLGQTITVYPISPTEIQMVTNYNGEKVNYDVTFTRTVVSPGVINYTNWSVQFLSGDIAKWTADGITNKVPPAFTIAPPATNSDPKVFELNYVSGGASGRYIDDTYTKQ